MMRRVVDLPQPDAPSSAVKLPEGMETLTRSRTVCGPNRRVTPFSSSVGVVLIVCASLVSFLTL